MDAILPIAQGLDSNRTLTATITLVLASVGYGLRAVKDKTTCDTELTKIQQQLWNCELERSRGDTKGSVQESEPQDIDKLRREIIDCKLQAQSGSVGLEHMSLKARSCEDGKRKLQARLDESRAELDGVRRTLEAKLQQASQKYDAELASQRRDFDRELNNMSKQLEQCRASANELAKSGSVRKDDNIDDHLDTGKGWSSQLNAAMHYYLPVL